RLKCIFKWEIDRRRPTGNVGRAVGIDGNTQWVIVANPTDICGINEPTRRAEFCDETVGKSGGIASLKWIGCWKIRGSRNACDIRIIGRIQSNTDPAIIGCAAEKCRKNESRPGVIEL